MADKNNHDNARLLGGALTRKSLARQVYEVLESSIIEGKLGPGVRLAEEQIAKQLSVSRSPVREAVAELQRVGLAERSGLHDRRVFVPTRKFVSDLFDLWIILESSQIYMSSQRASKADLDAIARLLERMQAALRNKRRYVGLSQAFSALLKKGCDNTLLNDVVNGHEKHLRWLEAIYYTRELESLKQVHDDHVTIFERFRQKDLTGLLDSIARHVNRQRERVLRLVTSSAAARSRSEGRLTA